MQHLTQRLLKKIALWSFLWLFVIGGVGALLNLHDTRDDRWRAELATHGSRTVGILSTQHKIAQLQNVRRCGKGSHAVLQFTSRGEDLRKVCINEELPPEYYDYLYASSLPDIRVGVAYDPEDPSHFFVTSPDGTVPRRNLEGIWRRWTKRTIIMLAIYSFGTALILWRQSRMEVA